MTDITKIRTIGFDADDTLWHNNNCYIETTERYYAIMRRYCSEPALREAFASREVFNLEELGYGAKALIISMAETALQLCPSLPPRVISEIIENGRELLRVPTVMIPRAAETLQKLSRRYRIVIITKGEINEQQRKFDNSPIDRRTPYYILQDKTPDAYKRLLERENIEIESFMMVGNSPRSDVLAPAQIGAYACYIPYCSTWAHEDAAIPPHDRIIQIGDIAELQDILL